VGRIKTIARLAGLLTLLTILGGVFAEGYVSDRLIDFRDAAATAANFRTHAGTLQLGYAVYMVEMACQLAATALFYLLLKPVNRGVNLVAAFLGLAGCVIKAVSRVFFVVPLVVLGGGAPYLGVFSAAQLQALSLLLLGINDRGAGMALIFMGFSTVLTGWLMWRSTFLPRFLGVLGIVSGAGWLTFLYPPLAYRVFLFAAGLGLLASAVLIFWLLVFGVDEAKWEEQAAGPAL
jgi:hypothetical protein